MKNLIRALAVLLLATAFNAFAAEAPSQPRSECVDFDPHPIREERVCFPYIDGYDLRFDSRDEFWRNDQDAVMGYYRLAYAHYLPHDRTGRVLYLRLLHEQLLPRESSAKLVEHDPRFEIYGELLAEAHNNPHGHDSADRTRPYNVLRRNSNGTLLFEACPFQLHSGGLRLGGWRGSYTIDVVAEGATAHQSVNRLVRRYLAGNMSTPTGCVTYPLSEGG